MKEYEDEFRFAPVWAKIRELTGYSQEQAAKVAHVSKKTWQNWEAGISEPGLSKTLRIFSRFDLNPMPLFLEILHPGEFADMSPDDDQAVEDALIKFIKEDCPADAKRKLLYWATGKHGHNPFATLELQTAYLLTPLSFALGVAQMVFTNFTVFGSKDAEAPTPNMDLFKAGIKSATHAVKNGSDSYTNV